MRKHLIILSDGLGRDSSAMVCLLLEGKLVVNGRTLHHSDVSAVVFSDPGYEWPHTYQVIADRRRALERVCVPFYALRKPAPEDWQPRVALGKAPAGDPEWVTRLADAPLWKRAEGGYYHRRAPILDDYQRLGRITIRASAGCTMNHKVEPINTRFINDLSTMHFGIGNRSWGAAVRRGDRPRHVVLIGIAADEAHRVREFEQKSHIEAAYPLVEMGITKADEAAILERNGLGWVRKSGCVACHFQPDSWFWALSASEPETFRRVVEYEQAALARNPRMFLRGDRPITEVVRRWRERNPTASVTDVLDKTYDRGGCAPVDNRQLSLPLEAR